ncbi:MAG: glycosyltransferase [Nitrospirales bacterium]|nr:glycosyltransferase [Nitrospirales bacterium]
MSFFSQWLGVFQEKFTIFSDKVSVDAQEGIESIGGGVQGVSSLTAYLEGVFEYLEPFLYIFGLSISIGITALGFFQNLIYLFQLILVYFVQQSRPPLKEDIGMERLMTTDSSLPISILIPAYNEEATVVESIQSLLSLRLRNFEIIVLNDGSTDATLQVILDAFKLARISRHYQPGLKHTAIRGIYGSSQTPNLFLVDKENGGKSDSLNAGINLSRFPLFCVIDADSLLEPDALLRGVLPFNQMPDLVALGGMVRIANGCTVKEGKVQTVALSRKLLVLLQTVEYLRVFVAARLAWSYIGAISVLSGAFSIFRRDVVKEIGGYSHGTVGEDMEIIMKIHHLMYREQRPYQISYTPEPVCWTEVPEKIDDLGRQRTRWAQGAMEVFSNHLWMLFNPRYGRIGFLTMPTILIADVLGPILEAMGYVLIPTFWFLDVLSLEFLIAYVILTFVFSTFISIGSLILEELKLKRFPGVQDLLILTGVAIIENFGYRQIATYWRVRGLWRFFMGKKEWGKVERRGFSKYRPSSTPS